MRLIGGIEWSVEPWHPVSRRQAVAFAVAAAGFLVVCLNTGGFVPVLDSANLVFHEAGHVIYGVFGETLALYGGTLGQLTMPAIALGAFWVRRRPLSVGVAALWLSQNFFNIARYAADARAQELPLVGGGEHDWTNILGRWGVLHADLQVARVFSVAGGLGMAVAAAWIFVRSRGDNVS